MFCSCSDFLLNVPDNLRQQGKSSWNSHWQFLLNTILMMLSWSYDANLWAHLNTFHPCIIQYRTKIFIHCNNLLSAKHVFFVYFPWGLTHKVPFKTIYLTSDVYAFLQYKTKILSIFDKFCFTIFSISIIFEERYNKVSMHKMNENNLMTIKRLWYISFVNHHFICKNMHPKFNCFISMISEGYSSKI